MTRTVRLLAAAMAAACASPASAADGPAMAKASQCTVCHATENRQVGPSFKEIAAKYKGDAKAADKLAASIKGGSSGKWGAVPMPPNGAVSDADAQALAAWILSL
jgi:cytochrome c